ncbi:MAG: hypothetical protein ACK5LS_02605, partial [Propioniciclava sp.]
MTDQLTGVESAPEELEPVRRRVLNDKPRPRVLVLGDVPDGVWEAVEELAPTSCHIAKDLNMVAQTARWADWDAVIIGPTMRRVDFSSLYR